MKNLFLGLVLIVSSANAATYKGRCALEINGKAFNIKSIELKQEESQSASFSGIIEGSSDDKRYTYQASFEVFDASQFIKVSITDTIKEVIAEARQNGSLEDAVLPGVSLKDFKNASNRRQVYFSCSIK